MTKNKVKFIFLFVLLLLFPLFPSNEENFDCDSEKEKKCEEIYINEENICSQKYEQCLLKCKTEEYEKCLDSLE